MASPEEVQSELKKRPKYQSPSTYPVIDNVIYLPDTTREFLNDVKNLPVNGDEVFVVSYPKSGTTWVSEIVWQILCDGGINKQPIQLRVPLVEGLKFFNNINTTKELVDFFVNQPSPRVFKTHLQYSLVPMGDGVTTRPKYINVIRNPKDCAVSFFHQIKAYKRNQFDGTWEEFFESFLDGEVTFGSWFDHVLGWWAHRHDPNILILKYEDMKKDLSSAVTQIAKFLDKDLSEQTIQLIANQTTFNAMSARKGIFLDHNKQVEALKKPGSSKFLRKGEIGDWKNYFTEEQNQRFDELYEKKMAGSSLEMGVDAMSARKGIFLDHNEKFEDLKKPGSSRFLRKGEVGDWKNYFTEEQNQRFDELSREENGWKRF